MIRWQSQYICTAVQGRYGCCRFLRDGHKTPKEVNIRETEDAAVDYWCCHLWLYCPPTCCVQLFSHALMLQSPHHFEICWDVDVGFVWSVTSHQSKAFIICLVLLYCHRVSRIPAACITSPQSWSCLKTLSVSGRSSGPTSYWMAFLSTALSR